MKDLMDSIISFLEENLGDNYIWITAGAAAAVLLIIIAIAAVKKKKNKLSGEDAAEPRGFFMEGEYDTMLRDAARASRAEASQPEAAAAEPEETEVSGISECTEEEQNALKEELQQVHININIELVQVKIGYEDDGKVTCIVETDEEQTNDPELKAALAAGGITDEEPQAAEIQQTEGGKEILAGQNIVLEKINLVKAAPAKKFGPDNFNTGRSGRVFTEEELREQIKQ